ncbi:MAG: hypothetical protein EXS05_10955 [Planctomycetaceae bacterium]|nr:hypothetical protein [Planctomycetaceae bacterium]
MQVETEIPVSGDIAAGSFRRFAWLTAAVIAAIVLALGLRFALPVYRQYSAVTAIYRLGGGVSFMEHTAPKWLNNVFDHHDVTMALERAQMVDLEGSRIDDNDILLLRNLPDVRFFSARDTNISDRGVSRLISCSTRWNSLWFDGSRRISDASLASLASCDALSVLTLNDTSVTDAGIVQIRKLNEIKSLRLDRTRVTGACIKSLSHLPQLEYLTLCDVPIDDDDLAALVSFPALWKIALDDTLITDRGMESIANMPRLRSVEVCGTKITDAGVETLVKGPALWWLKVSRTVITDSGLESIGKQVELIAVGLAGTRISDVGLASIAALPRLADVDVSDTELTDAALEHLDKIKNLQVLTIKNTRVTPAALAEFRRKHPNVRICD